MSDLRQGKAALGFTDFFDRFLGKEILPPHFIMSFFYSGLTSLHTYHTLPCHFPIG